MGLGEDIALWLMMCGNTIKSHLTLFFILTWSVILFLCFTQRKAWGSMCINFKVMNYKLTNIPLVTGNVTADIRFKIWKAAYLLRWKTYRNFLYIHWTGMQDYAVFVMQHTFVILHMFLFSLSFSDHRLQSHFSILFFSV